MLFRSVRSPNGSNKLSLLLVFEKHTQPRSPFLQTTKLAKRQSPVYAKPSEKSKISGNVRNLSRYFGNSKTILRSHASPPKSFLVAFLIIPNLPSGRTSQNRRFFIVAPNIANIILKVRIFQLPT